ncbi:MAG: PilX N-terminal domain-containing pilus assembly protein [Gemmatimonadales bacterium]
MKFEGYYALGSRHDQRGAVLVVGLIILMVLTVLGVSSMNTATLELTMTGNAQYHQEAFQAAETGIDISISRRDFNTITPAVVDPMPLDVGSSYYTEATSTFMENTPVPGSAFSMGVGAGSVQAFHFDVVARGTGPRNAASVHNQSFYIVGPGGI